MSSSTLPESRPKRFCGPYTSAAVDPPPHHLCWDQLEPKWPSEPDAQVARQLAISCLPDEFRDTTISFFAKGGFNRLFLLSSDHADQEYLMRVSLPVDPFFKTESEVATIAYLRKHTSIPVPSVVAYDSRARNPLGFEWILMERLPGVPLGDLWDDMTRESKSSLTDKIAPLLKQLRERHFSMSGNIYFSDIWNLVGYRPLAHDSKENPEDLGIDDNKEFVIGRMVAPIFYGDKRLLLTANRGPFASSEELIRAELELLGERVKHLSTDPSGRYYCETDVDLAEEHGEVLETCRRLEPELSRIFSQSKEAWDKKILWHDDLSAMNILVDPKTYELQGIVDWESASIVPTWKVDGAPLFLRGIEVEEPPPPSPEIDEEGLIWIRKDWEMVLLRRRYTAVVPSLEEDDALKLRKRFAGLLADFEDRWTAARFWLENKDNKEVKFL